jgi:hypothetical protein
MANKAVLRRPWPALQAHGSHDRSAACALFHVALRSRGCPGAKSLGLRAFFGACLAATLECR